MPRTTRKTKLPFNPGQVGKGHDLPVEVLSLAAEYGIDTAALLDWKVYPSGKVVLIAPNGMKLVRTMDAPVDASAAADAAVSEGAHER